MQGLQSLPEVALWLLLQTAAIHPQGHNLSEAVTGQPVHVDYRNFSENWKPTGDWRKDATFAGAGFDAQNLGQRMVGNTNYNTANAIYKALYAITAPRLSGGGSDINDMKQFSGNKSAGAMLAIDALSDILFDNKDRSLDFTTRDGIPALLLNYRW